MGALPPYHKTIVDLTIKVEILSVWEQSVHAFMDAHCTLRNHNYMLSREGRLIDRRMVRGREVCRCTRPYCNGR